MKQLTLRVQSNIKMAKDVYCISLAGDCSEIERAGQFVDILVDDLFLRRPFSILDHDDSHLEILYRVVGQGTEALAGKKKDDTLDVLLPLGNGFDIEKRGIKTLLIAGGIGMPPIYELANMFHTMQKGDDKTSASYDFRVLLGFRSAKDMFGTDRFSDIGMEPVIATEDGSFGIHGNVTDAMRVMKESSKLKAGSDHAADDAGRAYDSGCTHDSGCVYDSGRAHDSGHAHDFNCAYDFDCVMCCGPEPMLKAVYEAAVDMGINSGQFSFEERMGCGFGACMGCSCKTKYGNKRICKDGPVLDLNEIVWK